MNKRTTMARGSPPPPTAAPSVQSPYPPGRWRSNTMELERVVLWPSHLLIRHADVEVSGGVSFSLTDFRNGLPPATRTREQALALATELARHARREPERFAELVREHRARSPGGAS